MKNNVVLMVLYWVFLVVFILGAWVPPQYEKGYRVVGGILFVILGLAVFGNPAG